MGIDKQMGIGIIGRFQVMNRHRDHRRNKPPHRHRTIIAAPGKFTANMKNAGNIGFFEHAPSGNENHREIKWLRFAINGAETDGRRKRKSMGRKAFVDGSQSESQRIAKWISIGRKVFS
jgi:hypothetical protein